MPSDRSEYYKRYHQKNREKRQQQRKQYDAQPKRREYRWKRRGVLWMGGRFTWEHFLLLLEFQQGQCVGCGKTTSNKNASSLTVDHDHATGEARMLLCSFCNRTLGPGWVEKRLINLVEALKNPPALQIQQATQ